jgi:hypothetical protein
VGIYKTWSENIPFYGPLLVRVEFQRHVSPDNGADRRERVEEGVIKINSG